MVGDFDGNSRVEIIVPVCESKECSKLLYFHTWEYEGGAKNYTITQEATEVCIFLFFQKMDLISSLQEIKICSAEYGYSSYIVKCKRIPMLGGSQVDSKLKEHSTMLKEANEV